MSSNPSHIPDTCPPQYLEDGTLNRAHYAYRLKEIGRQQEDSLKTDRKGIAGFDALRKNILAEAEMLGLSPAAIHDERSDAERMIDAVGRMLETNGESVFEETDATVAAIEKAMRAAVDGTHAIVHEKKTKIINEAHQQRTKWSEKQLALGKRWLSLLERIRRLRTLAREKIPKVKSRLPGHLSSEYDDAYESSWYWRLAVYVYRSDLAPDRNSTGRPCEKVLEIAKHHCVMSYRLWEARNAVKIYAAGSREEQNKRPDLFNIGPQRDLTLTKKNVYRCEGCILICPPRHGKSTLGTAFMVAEMVENPRLQSIILHAHEDKAAENFRQVKAAFDAETPMGRRGIALFNVMLTKEDDSKVTMRLVNRERTRDPQARAKGVRSGIGGANADLQWWDDPVLPEEANQSEVRENTHRKLTGQFLQRKQGKRPFVLITATIWHYDDAVNRLIDQSRKNQIAFAYSIQRVGGPKTKPEFYPLWPSKYPASALRQRFRELNSPSDYAAQFMANPRPDELRIIKSLAVYDPADERHRQFVQSAEFIVSIDPSATKAKDAKRQTDKAGMVYAACGDFVTQQASERMTTVETARRIRIFDIREFYAGPSEAADEISIYAAQRPVDRVLIEVVNFSSAIVEMVRNRYGLGPSQVIGMSTNNKSKETRLRSVSPMLDDSGREQGLPGAVVEFPGVRDETGKLVLDPRFDWAYKQILDFGSVQGDHAVDAITQLCKYLQSEVNIGGGDVTEAILMAETPTHESARRQKLLDAYQADDDAASKEQDPWEKELDFMNERMQGNFPWN